MKEPSHHRPPELCGTCVKCGIGEVVRQGGGKSRGQCRLCYRISHRVWVRKRAGWPVDMLDLPPGPAGVGSNHSGGMADRRSGIVLCGSRELQSGESRAGHRNDRGAESLWGE